MHVSRRYKREHRGNGDARKCETAGSGRERARVAAAQELRTTALAQVAGERGTLGRKMAAKYWSLTPAQLKVPRKVSPFATQRLGRIQFFSKGTRRSMPSGVCQSKRLVA